MQSTPWDECSHAFLYSGAISFDLIENTFDDLYYSNTEILH